MALEQARRNHETKVQEIEKARAVLDKRSQAENARWEKKRVPNDHEVKDEAQRGSCPKLARPFLLSLAIKSHRAILEIGTENC